MHLESKTTVISAKLSKNEEGELNQTNNTYHSSVPNVELLWSPDFETGITHIRLEKLLSFILPKINLGTRLLNFYL